jgi:hypothetical protein
MKEEAELVCARRRYRLCGRKPLKQSSHFGNPAKSKRKF